MSKIFMETSDVRLFCTALLERDTAVQYERWRTVVGKPSGCRRNLLIAIHFLLFG